MKRYLIVTAISLCSLLSVHSQVKKVAMLETIPMSDGIGVMITNMIRAELTKTISIEDGYAAFSRTDVDKMMKEMNFQSSGMVDDAQMSKLGEMSGAQYVCVSKVTKDQNAYYIEGSLIDIETGEIVRTATSFVNSISSSEVNKHCRRLGKELLYGAEVAEQMVADELRVENVKVDEASHSSKTENNVRIKPNYALEANFLEYGTENVGNIGLTHLSTNRNGWGYYWGGAIGWKSSLFGDDGQLLSDTYYTTGDMACGFFASVSGGGVITLAKFLRLYAGVSGGYYRVAEEMNTTLEYSWAINPDLDKVKIAPEGGIILFSPDFFMLKYGVSYNAMPYNESGIVHHFGISFPLQ